MTTFRIMTATSDLSGRFYLTFHASGALEYQGQILGSPQPAYYLCQVHDGFGYANHQVIVPIADIVGWKLYTTEEQWRTAGEACIESDRSRR